MTKTSSKYVILRQLITIGRGMNIQENHGEILNYIVQRKDIILGKYIITHQTLDF